MARKTTYEIQINTAARELARWELIANTDSQGAACLIAKLWRNHLEDTNKWTHGAAIRVIDARTLKLIYQLVVGQTQSESPHPMHCNDPLCIEPSHGRTEPHNYGLTAECINCHYTEESDGYGGFDCPECEGPMIQRPATREEAEQRDTLATS